MDKIKEDKMMKNLEYIHIIKGKQLLLQIEKHIEYAQLNYNLGDGKYFEFTLL